MYQPVTDQYGQVVGYNYVDGYGQQQFVPIVGMPADFMQSSLPPSPPPPAPPPTMGWLSGDRRDQYAPRGYQPPEQPQNAFGAPTQPGAGFGGPAAAQGAAGNGYYQKYAGLNAKLRGQATEAADTVRAKATGTYDSGMPTDADYARSEHRYNKDMRQDQRYAKQVQSSQALFANPTWAFKPGDLSRRDYSYLSQTPLTQLAFLTQGATGKDRWTTNDKRFGNVVQGMANSMDNGMEFQQDSLMQNLFNPGRKSALARSFMALQQGDPRYDKNGIYLGSRKDKFQWAPATTQADAMRSYLSAIYSTTTAPQFQQPAMNYVNQLIDQWASRAYSDKKPGSLQQWLGNQMGY